MTLLPFIQKPIQMLEQKGFEAFVVGGAVRDFLLGHTPHDFDIATSALPTDVIGIFGEKNCIPTGIKHGTVTLVQGRDMLEITTYRIDGEYLDGRHPEGVTFSKNIYDDLSRRDFTINAIAYNPKSGFVDPFYGQTDLKSRLVRAVGDPLKRFGEDALRIIRGLRFAATLGFDIETDTKDAIHQCRHLLCGIAKERIQAELSRLLMADAPDNILINYFDVFAKILGAENNFCEKAWRQNAKKIGICPPNLCVRLAILLDGVTDMLPYELLRRLKYDNKTISTVKTLYKYIDLNILPEPVAIKHILSQLGEDNFRLVVAAKSIKYPESKPLMHSIENILNQILSSGECYLQKDLAINGTDLLELGIEGKEIGQILKFLLNEVIECRCKNEKDALIEQIKN